MLLTYVSPGLLLGKYQTIPINLIEVPNLFCPQDRMNIWIFIDHFFCLKFVIIKDDVRRFEIRRVL